MGRALNLSQFQHNVTDGTTTVGTGFVVNGSAKAWINFNGSGTVAIGNSQNVSSLTDGGTGLYDINISSAFSNINFCPVGSVIGDDTTSNRSYALVASISANTTTKIDISTVNANVTEAYRDFANINVSAHGDLA